MLTVYFDASLNKPSKTRPNPPLIHSVGCYLARKTDWDKFRKEWRAELSKKNVPYFHMKDFEYAQSAIRRAERNQIGKKNPFKDWSEAEFVPFQKRLYKTINRKRKDGSYRMAAFTSSIVMPDFDKTLPNELKNDPECKSYYVFNVANLMKMIAYWCSSNVIYDPIHYIFASGDGEGNNIENWFNYCWKDEQSKNYYRLSKDYNRKGYETQLMQDVPALQAADIAAYEFNKVAIEVAQRGDVNIALDELRRSLPSLCRTGHYSFTLTEENLSEAFSQIIRFRKSKGIS